MKKGIMLLRESPGDNVEFRVACGCEEGSHDWRMEFTRPHSDIPGYMEIEVTTHSEVGYASLWRRIKRAWRLIFHRWDDHYTTFVMQGQEVAAFEEAIRHAKEVLFAPEAIRPGDMVELSDGSVRTVKALNLKQALCSDGLWHLRSGLEKVKSK